MKKSTIIVLIFVVISLLLFLSTTVFSVSVFNSFSHRLLAPGKAYLYSITTSQEQESALASENKKLTEQLVDIENIKRDNEALRSQYDTPDTVSPQSLVPASVVGFEGIYTSPTALILDKGSDDGVRIGTGVISGKHLIGKVGMTNNYYSKVLLVNNPQFKTAATISDNPALGVIKGQEDFLLLDEVVITDTVEKDEVVLTKGELNSSGIGVPSNLIVGKIVSIDKDESQPFQTARVMPLINYGTLNTVFIVSENER